MEKLKSRKLWVTIIATVIVILNKEFAWGIPEATIWQLVTVAIGYLFANAINKLTM